MKTILNIIARRWQLVSLLVVMTLTGCTHNNGDIGPLFGRWTLREAVAQGIDLPANSVIDFQNKVVRVTRVDGNGDTTWSIGTWHLDEGNYTLTLDFTHDDDNHSGQYALPTWIGLTEPVTTFDVATLSSSTLVLETPTLLLCLTKQY